MIFTRHRQNLDNIPLAAKIGNIVRQRILRMGGIHPFTQLAEGVPLHHLSGDTIGKN